MVDLNEEKRARARVVVAGIGTGVSDRIGDIWWSFLVRGIFASVLGIFALFWPTLSLSVLVIGIAIYCIVDGFAGLVFAFRASGGREYFAQALVSLGIGAVLLFWPEGSLRALLILFGVLILFMGISYIMAARQLSADDPDRGLMMALGGIAVIVGVILILWPGSGVVTISWVIGIAALLLGVLLISLAMRFRKLDKRVESRV